METSKEAGKRIAELDEEGEEDEDAGEDNKKKRALSPSKRRVSGAGGSTQRSCQVEDCTADMADARPYHRRHKVCEFHAKAAVVFLAGLQQRFCSTFTFCLWLPCLTGFMSYKSLMKLNEVAAGVWQDTTSDAARAHMILIEKRRIKLMPFFWSTQINSNTNEDCLIFSLEERSINILIIENALYLLSISRFLSESASSICISQTTFQSAKKSKWTVLLLLGLLTLVLGTK